MINKLFGESFAMMLIGDGILSLVQPKRHLLLWIRGPRQLKEPLDEFLQRPGMTQLVGALEVALGIWLAAQQKPQADD